ncbi:uncharacterized protein K02A2.6-like [Achroia grisella]|uniref:uncharacterized protein K02A2.6-like n=1 Tax=Achroia grisella TaxID=688607 RepID=UPI0027D22E07|nr:uncharacterized protein K02A2.6-like [Achroia grisella]
MEHARPPSELCLDGSPVSRADAWQRWKTQFKLFLKASGVHKEEPGVQASLLINLIGADGFDIYETFTFESDEERDDINIVLKKFDIYFGVKINITLARYNFFSRNQEQGETISQYVVALRLLSKNCAFASLEEELIRDRIVCGIRSGVVRDRLLRAEDLTLDKAIKICEADEVSADSSRCLEARGACVAAVAVRGAGGAGGGAGRRPRGGGYGRGRSRGRVAPAHMQVQCRGCGRKCTPGACPAQNVQCFMCHNYGHFARMCESVSVKKMYDIDMCDEAANGEKQDDCELFFISMLTDVSVVKNATTTASRDEWYELLKCDGGTEKFKLDSGADINVLSYERFKSLGFVDSILENRNNIKLQSYSGNIIPIRGVCKLRWYHKSYKYDLFFAIANILCESVLGRQTCINLGLIKRCDSVRISDYNDLFEGLGCLPGEYHIVVNSCVQPVVSAPRKVPLALQDKLRTELDRMIGLGVIRKVSHPTPWVNSVVIVAKKNGDLRICLDPRPLNCAIQRAHFQLPTVTEIATKLQGAIYFSVLDANSGFWAIKLDEPSADLCTFSSPFGRYQYTRLPYGLNCAPEVFHATVKQLLEGLDGVDSFVDDIICWGRTKQEHDDRLQALLERARKINLKFNKNKCKICVQEVTYLGHIFNKDGMKPDCSKVTAIKEMPVPTDKKSLERFLGAVNYLSKFIPNYSDRTFPLTGLLKKDIEWMWGSSHQRAVDELKHLISVAPVLALYDVRAPVVVSVDASAVALGAVLLQAGRPVEYASRTLTDTQSRYAQIEKELLAIVFACEKYHQYIYGKKNVIVETDHKPLENIFKKPLQSVPARLQRMLLRLQGYDLNVTYKPGKYMYLADTLSRAPLSIPYDDSVSRGNSYQINLLMSQVKMSQNKLQLVRNETEKCEVLSQLMKYINAGWPSNKYDVIENLKFYWSIKEDLFIVDGVIFKSNLVIIPDSLKTEMLKIIHDGHLGIDRCKRRAREVLFWPGITKDIELYVKRCAVCQEYSNAPAREPMLPVEIPILPWNKAMKEIFARHGIPEVLVSDNGTQFTSREFKKFASEWGFDQITTSPNYAQANGKSERAVQTVKHILKKSITSGSDFYLNLLSYHNTPRDSLSSPAQMLMGRRLKCRLPVHPDVLKPKVISPVQHDVLIEKQIKSKQYYDTHSKILPKLKSGDNRD